MKTLKILANTLLAVMGILVMGGAFDWNIGEGMTMLAGGIMMVCSVWIAVIVNKKD